MTSKRVLLHLMIAVSGCALVSSTPAMDVTFRLVRSDVPGQLVSTACTKIDVQAELDKAKADETAGANAQAARSGGKTVVTDVEVKPKAEFDHYVNYMRGIVIDGKHPFQRMYDNSYLGRSDVITLSLADGAHTIDPGDHKFSIGDGKITTNDSSLHWTGTTLDVIAYPVSILAVDGSSVRNMPAELRRLPVAMRILNGSEELLPKEKYLSPAATFKHLTLYMLTNSVGQGYKLIPSERQFHLAETGVIMLDSDGKQAAEGDAPVEDRFTITIPKVAVPILVRGEKVHVSIEGPSGSLSFDTGSGNKETLKTYYAFSAAGGAEITAGTRVPAAQHFFADFGAYPRRKIVIDAGASESREPRILQVALPTYETQVGKALRIRVQLVDSYDAATVGPPEVAAYAWAPPILQDNGWLRAGPDDSNINLSEWRTLQIQSTSKPDTYDVVMPVLPGNLYWLRIVVDKRGATAPSSALHADFIQGITDSAAQTNLSLFCPTGRHAFLNGSDLPISVVVKTTQAVPAGRLRLVLKQGAAEYTLIDRDMPALEPGCHPFHFVAEPAVTSALSAGEYQLSANLGATKSNTWSVNIAEPRMHASFPIYGTGRFSHYDVDNGSTYVNVPPSIKEANAARELFRRNASILGRSVDTVLLDWYGFSPLANYQGRDSSSEVAEVEKVLRQTLTLPAHEVYYYQNHFEAVHEALMHEGIGEINGVKCNLSMISLMHSVEKDVHSEMRKFQLISQIGLKFENFDGLSLVYPNTDPLGNSEIVDPGRHARMEALNKNFKAKYGFEPPTMAGATDFITALLRGMPIKPELAEESRKWEAWMTECNGLLGDFYATARKALDPIIPKIKLVNEGPGWGNTSNATYPVTANANQSPLMVWTGFSDFAYNLILEPYLRPKYLRMTGEEIWGTLFVYSGMHDNIKKHMIEHLAAGVHGFGYAGNSPLLSAADYNTKYLPEEYREIRDFLHTYGPMFAKANPKAEVGVFYPFHQTMYEIMKIDSDKWKGNVGVSGAYTCMTQLTLLGYDYEVVSEEMIDQGELDRFKVLVIPALHHLLPKHKEAIERFAQRGGSVILGSLSTVVPKGSKKIDDDFEELGEINTRSRDPFDVDHAWWFSEMRRKIPVLREALEPVLQPFAKPATDHLMIQSTRAGDGRYTFVWDMLYPSFMGTSRLTDSPDSSFYRGEANEQTMMPIKETVSFPAQSVTYDLLSQKAIDLSQAKDGRAQVQCDLSFTPFRIYVTLPQALASLRIESSDRASMGSQFPIKVTPLDGSDKPINAAIPLKVTVLDSAGRKVIEKFVSSVLSYEDNIPAPLGFAPGNWKVSVEELLSGHRSAVEIAVDKPNGLPFEASMKSVPEVDVQRPDLVRDSVEARKKDGEAVWIVLSDSQSAKYRPIAQTAAQKLSTLGIKSEIRQLSDMDVFAKEERLHLWEGWSEMSPSQYIEHHILLLGGEGENTLIEELQESQLLLRPLTASYPGPGRGVLTVIRSPFAFGRDVLCAFGPDVAGVQAAVNELIKTPAQPEKHPDAAQSKLVAKQNVQSVKANPSFESMDGAPVQCICASPNGERIAFGTLGYAKNVFVFDASGKLVFEDKIGHVDTQNLNLLPDQRMAVSSDGFLYLREQSGEIRWRQKFQRAYQVEDYVDPAGRYIVLSEGNAMHVCDLNLNPIWKFDDWNQCESTQDILFGRKARFMAAVDEGRTIVYRLSGKAPGIAGTEADDVIYCDALTGKEIRRVPVNMREICEFANIPGNAKPEVHSFTILKNGAFALVEFRLQRRPPDYILLDKELKPLARNRFTMPAYIAGKSEISHYSLLGDRRLVFVNGDTLSVSNVLWNECKSVCTSHVIVSLLVDETRQQIIISNDSGHLHAYNFDLKELWDTDLSSDAHLMLMPDGRIAAGTMRGQAHFLDADGHILWTNSLNRFAPPEEVERRWAQLESISASKTIKVEDWWDDLAKNVELGQDLANLNGSVTVGKPLVSTFQGEAFGTYLVEWHYGQSKTACSINLDITEQEKSIDKAPGMKVSRLARSVQSGENEFVDRSILRLGDRPGSVDVSVRSECEAKCKVIVRPLKFPSEDLIRIPALYRNMASDAAFLNPPVKIEMYPDPPDQWTGWWAEPFCLVNGRMFEREAGLLGGKWFGGNNTAQVSSNSARMPCYVEFTLPRKRFLSHVVVAEDPSLPRVETLTVDVYVEPHEVRKNLTELEGLQPKRGYWTNFIKRKGNAANYNVYKLPEIVYTNKVRVYLLNGYSSVDEVEFYESVPKLYQKPASPEKEKGE